MSYTKETIDYEGMSIDICYDEYADSPREWDNLGTIYSNHRDYEPDGHKLSELYNDFEYDVDKYFGSAEDYDSAFLKWLNDTYIWLQVSAYEHSGITIWCGDYRSHYDAQWDCGTFGIIAVEKSAIRRQHGWKYITGKREEHIMNILRGEIKTLDNYFTGEVYSYKIEDENGDFVDSCGGYYGDEGLKDAISDAMSAIDYTLRIRHEMEVKAMQTALAKHISKRKSQIKSHAPLYARTAFAF